MQTKIATISIVGSPLPVLTSVERKLIGLRLERLLTTHFEDMANMLYYLRVSKEALKSWFTGDRIPNGRNLLSIASYGFNVQWILTGHGYAYDLNTEQGRERAETGLVVLNPTIDDVIATREEEGALVC